MSRSLDEMINGAENITLSDYLNELLVKKGLTKSDVIERSRLSRNTVYPLFNGYRQGPSKNILLAIGFAMKLSLEEMFRLLAIADDGMLYRQRSCDAAIIYCIPHHYSLDRTDEILYDHGFDTIQKME